MKAKKIFMTILVMMGFVIAKAQGYPPELALVSQPVMTYNDYDNTITLYYDVQNIGDARYKGYVYIYLDPDDGYYYAKKRVNVCPGRIKRIAIDIPAYRPNPSWTYTVMPYYSLGSELYSFTTFEYFEPLTFYWNGPRTEVFYVTVVPPRPRYYTRPAEFRFYYDGYRPPMPPPMGYGPGAPMPPHHNPMHHTYSYHYNNGGYPVNHPDHYGEGYAPINGNSQATVRPNGSNTPGSMSSHGENNGSTNANSGSNSGATVRPNPTNNLNGNGATTRPNNSGTSSNQNGATTRPDGNSNNGSSNVTRPSSGNSSSSSRPSSGSNSSNVNRPNNGSTSRPNNSGTSSSSGNVNRPSSGNSSSSSRPSSGSSSSNANRPNNGSTSRPNNSGTSSSSGNVNRPSSGNSSSSGRTGTSSSSSSSSRSSSSSSSRGGSSSRSR